VCYGLPAGAFPEIQVAQYPLDMGRPTNAGKSNQVLAVSTGADGQINYDAVLRQGQDKGKIIVSGHSALVPKVDLLADGV
jgi:SNW domain-containing protein 1